MPTKKWSEIKAQRFTPEELDQIDRETARELLEEDEAAPDTEKSAELR